MPATSDLEPQVKGRLADTERSILELLQAHSGDRYRTSISIDPELALAAVRAAAKEHRDSLSSLIDAAVAAYTERHGPLPAELTEFMGQLAAAHAANPAIVTKLKAALRREVRPKKTAA
jgi:iron-sulfur cluster repair protein YtfE (RIC family)